jgi:hypothetical protein
MMGPICWSLTLPLLLGAAQDDLPPNWKIFVSKEGRFSAAMPGTPTESKKKVLTATGQLDACIAVAESKNESFFVVSYCDFPAKELKAETADKRLDQACKGAVESARGKLRSETTIKLGDQVGREIVIEKDGEIIAKMRIFLVERRLYQVMVLGNSAIFAPKEKDVGFFLDSFALNK